MAIVVSLSDQMCYVYRNGVRIGRAQTSTGKPGHETPTGVFHILNKDKDHRSKTYNNAAMPYSERLTWDGVALHAGGLPGYPSSHGCIHLPYKFSELLFGATHVGVPVVITNERTRAYVSTGHPASMGMDGAQHFGAVPEFSWNPGASPEGPVSIVVSEADKKAYVMRDGVEIGHAPVAVTARGRSLAGTHAYSLLPGGRDAWMRLGGAEKSHAVKMADYFHFHPTFAAKISPLLKPGIVLVATAEPVTLHSRSEGGFTVLAAGSIAEQAAGPKKE